MNNNLLNTVFAVGATIFIYEVVAPVATVIVVAAVVLDIFDER